MDSKVNATLEYAYRKANRMVAAPMGQGGYFAEELEKSAQLLMERAETSKAVLTVLITSLVYKILHPAQDIRCHQKSIAGGYAGRLFDTHYITPFLKRHRFPAMAESGWLTRSLEHKEPYEKGYGGAISPPSVKKAFLELIDHVEHCSRQERWNLLLALFARLIEERDKKDIILATPQALTISQIIDLLHRHFTADYIYAGASRLPVLAIYAIHQVLVNEMERYKDATLLPLERHNSADTCSGRYGDIDIILSGGTAFEAIEVKSGILLECTHVNTAYEKFMGSSMKRYYILSTVGIREGERELIDAKINEIKSIHSCQVIVNGVLDTLRYYLRLIDDPAIFIEAYVALLKGDEDIHYEQRVQWNSCVNGGV